MQNLTESSTPVPSEDSDNKPSQATSQGTIIIVLANEKKKLTTIY